MKINVFVDPKCLIINQCFVGSNSFSPEMSLVDTVEKNNDRRQMSVVVRPSDVDGRQMIMVMEPDPLIILSL